MSSPITWRNYEEDRQEQLCDSLVVWFEENVPDIGFDIKEKLVGEFEDNILLLDLEELEQLHSDHIGAEIAAENAEAEYFGGNV